jgi:2-isopropylmalate synthase
MNLTSRSGSHMVKARLRSLGYAEAEIDIGAFYRRFIALADKKGTVYDDDLIMLMESKSSDDMKDRHTLEYLNVSSGRGVVPTATVRIAVDGVVKQEAACGDGAVDAATRAIDRVAGFSVPIEEFHLDAVTEGREAVGKVKIIGRTAKGLFVGNGTSTDIVEASALAYMDLINKVDRIRKFGKKNGKSIND